MMTMTQEKMMAATRQREDPQVTALKLQLELLQKQFLMLNAPSGTGNGGGNKVEGSTNQNINPKTSQSWNGIVGLADVAATGANTVL